MKNIINVENLDRETMEFAAYLVWQYKALCKNTKEGRIEEKAYSRVLDSLKAYSEIMDQEEC